MKKFMKKVRARFDIFELCNLIFILFIAFAMFHCTYFYELNDPVERHGYYMQTAWQYDVEDTVEKGFDPERTTVTDRAGWRHSAKRLFDGFYLLESYHWKWKVAVRRLIHA